MNKLLGVISTLILGVEVSASVVHRIAKFSVEPNLQSAIAVNDSFRDSLYITDVVGMYAWQACVLYDPSVIRWKSHKEGPFMTNVSTTMFLISADTINGKVLVSALFMPPGYPYYTVSGSGSVLYITWQVKSSGKSPIRIRHENTGLMDTLDNHIPFDTVDGWYNPPGIAIFSPVEGEYRKRGNSYIIKWGSGGVSDVKIELWKGGSLNSTIISSTPSDGSHNWAIPADQEPGSDYKLKVMDVSTPSVYDSVTFNICRQIEVTSPNGGETLYVGSIYDITWITSGTSDSVKITWWGGTINTTLDDGLYSWTIPNTPTTYGWVTVRGFNCASNSDMSDGYFTVATPPGVDESSELKSQISNIEVYPNPFSQSTVISYQLPVKIEARSKKQEARLTIYDLTGRLVRTLPISNSVVWDGTADDGNRLPSGIYFCKLQVGNESLTKQVFLLR